MSSAAIPEAELGAEKRRLTVSSGAFRVVAGWALWALVAIVITGALVRLTGSGLGCSDWPNCEPGEFVPAADFHGWVEFGNRLVTGVVSLAVIAAVLASLRRQPRRADLVWWSLGLVAGVLFQIVLGAVTVLTHLSPPIVMSHFLASQVLVAAAVVLAHRAAVSPNTLAKNPAARSPDRLPARLPARLRVHSRLIALLTAAALFTGTVVTGTGPHGGDENVERLQFALPSVARVHGLIVVALIAAVLLLAFRVRRIERAANATRGAGALARPLRNVVGVMAVQAAIGYVQYFTELPVLLVALHVAGATLLTIAVTRLLLAIENPTQSSRDAHVEAEPVGIAPRGFAE